MPTPTKGFTTITPDDPPDVPAVVNRALTEIDTALGDVDTSLGDLEGDLGSLAEQVAQVPPKGLVRAAEIPTGDDSLEIRDETGELLIAFDGIGTASPRQRSTATGGGSDTSGNVHYVVRPSGDPTGATDLANINNALADHPVVTLAPGQWHASASYVLPSNTRLHIEGPFTSTLAAGANSNLITNTIGVEPTRNIAVTAVGPVTVDGNAANQTRMDTSPNHAGWRNIGVHFANVEGLEVEGLTWANTAMFGGLCTGVRDAHFHNVRVEQDFSQPNQDGLDFGPGCSDIWVDGFTGNTEDDVHSIFAKYSTSQRTVHPLYLPADALYVGSPAGALYSPEGNNTHDLHFHRSHVNAGKNFFRLQAAEGSKLYGIRASDIRHTGPTACRAMVIFGEMIAAYIDAPPAADGSDFYDIKFDGFGGRVLSLVYADSYFRDVAIRNVELASWGQIISQRDTTDLPAQFSRLSIDGLTSGATASADIGNLITLTGGMVARDVELSRINLAAVKRLIANTDSTAANVRLEGYVGSASADPFFLGGTATTTGHARVRFGTAPATTGPLPTAPAGSTLITTEGA